MDKQLDALIDEIVGDAKWVGDAYSYNYEAARAELAASRAALVAYVAEKDAEIERLRKSNKAWSVQARLWRSTFSNTCANANNWWCNVRNKA